MIGMIGVIDCGMGNVGSIVNMLAKVGAKAQIVSSADALNRSEKLILPGVGHFDRGIRRLDELSLRQPLEQRVLERGVPILGICLGMQLMCKTSEEGECAGLGWINAQVRRFDRKEFPNRKVPHMGWNRVEPVKASVFFDLPPEEPQRFYFVHSYYVDCVDQDDVLTTTVYGGSFCSSFLRGNICGVQFHPEKGHAYGMALLRRFVAW